MTALQLINGVYLPAGDTHFAQHLLSGPTFEGRGTYQFAKIQMALDVVPTGRRALDIGAHVGLWSMVLASHFAAVEAFEPLPEHYFCFGANLAGCVNVTLHRTALSSQAGELRMAQEAENSGNAHVDMDGDVTVPVARLDDFDFADVDFIKIDVEGFERFVVEGGEGTIRRWKPTMVVEQKRGHAERYGDKRGSAVALLQKWGAAIAWERSGDFCLTWS